MLYDDIKRIGLSFLKEHPEGVDESQCRAIGLYQSSMEWLMKNYGVVRSCENLTRGYMYYRDRKTAKAKYDKMQQEYKDKQKWKRIVSRIHKRIGRARFHV